MTDGIRFKRWWQVPAELQPGETVRFTRVANRLIGPTAVSAGRLYVTNRRVVFVPGWHNVPAARRQVWSVKIGEVHDCSESAVILAPVPVARKCVDIEVDDGAEAFIVWKPHDVAGIIRSLCAVDQR